MKSQPLTVLHLTTSFPQTEKDFSGLFIVRLMDALGKTGVNCQVLAPAGMRRRYDPDSRSIHRFRYAPLSWQRLVNQRGGIPHVLKENPFLFALVPLFLASMALHAIVLGRQCDLIHAHWSICGALAVLTRRLHKKPVITTLRGTDMRWGETTGPYRWLHRLCIKKSFLTVGVSQEIVTKLRGSYPWLTDRFVFIPNGVSKEFYDAGMSPARSSSVFQILFVGNLVPAKGVASLIRAMALIGKSRKVRLTIAGDGPEKVRLQDLAQEYGVEDNVGFLGTVPPGEVPALLSRHHVLVLPSLGEGRPNVILEAMAAGLPVVGTDIKGIRELVQDGQTGWIVPPGDSHFLASVLEDMCNGRNDGAAAGRAGRRWMLEQGLTWETTAFRYQELYCRAVAATNHH